jgi:hypothetical protein
MNVNGLARLRWTRHPKRSGGWVCALSGGGVSRHELLNGFSLPPSAKPARLCERVWSPHDDLWTRKRPQRNRLVVGPSPHARDRVPLDWNGTFLKLLEADVNLIFLDRGCLDKDTNWNEAIAVSRITQNDQIGLLEPG